MKRAKREASKQALTAVYSFGKMPLNKIKHTACILYSTDDALFEPNYEMSPSALPQSVVFKLYFYKQVKENCKGKHIVTFH